MDNQRQRKNVKIEDFLNPDDKPQSVPNGETLVAADTYIIFNENDPDLIPIRYELPPTPPYRQIDGHDLPIAEQYFRPTPKPPRLLTIAKMPISDDEKVRLLEANPTYYSAEIEFIQQEWERRDKGYHFMNNGKPCYISGQHYYFLNYWHIQHDIYRLPIFTMHDREVWLFAKMTDADDRCLGVNWPKGRRGGATSIVSCWRFERATRMHNHHAAMQSMTDTSANTLHYNHIIYGWDKMMFYFRPIYDGDNRKTSEVKFFSPRSRSNADYGKQALESRISYANSGEKAYDGDRVNSGVNDEIGKTKEVNVYERFRVQKPTAKIGSRIVGKWWNVSTVEEMEQEGGKYFKQICDESHYDKRVPATGETLSGCYNLFIPAWRKMEGVCIADGKPWIDQYGYPHPDAEKYLIDVGQAYLDDGNTDGWANWFRMYPCKWRDCWRPAAKNSPFNIAIITKRIEEIDRHIIPLVSACDFKWAPGKEGEAVIRIPNSDGKFLTSWDFTDPDMANKRIFDATRTSGNKQGIYLPGNTHLFIAGGDPYGARATKGKRQSKAAMAIKYKMDYTVDAGKPHDQWVSDRFILTYNQRTETPEEFCEDFLMACIYHGCEMFPETNIGRIWDYFEVNGFGGYMYFAEHWDGSMDKTPGERTSAPIKEDIFYNWQRYIKFNGYRECHKEILFECRDITGPDDMTDFDVFTAGGYALLGEHKQKTMQSMFSTASATAAIELDDYFEATDL